ncbi:hypothetical protein CFE53_05685 [Methanofervidicoccus sp. A16]|uniref:DUF1890 domain-containing protein n=1 Tax=Methanofervidicoccus sp. A16 TaxID=2607662 RepID=UPI001188D065|nr:DUF1890 domain-containing protein [Methanofervidicoccus sp. A16]AXI25641.1 hypothetical protein CFE53_05685 [Methanofervidicoccus sp. A16]MBW9220144.1 DUF1890 family protein [Methanothermococcus sp. SCGC AD-155-N22]
MRVLVIIGCPEPPVLVPSTIYLLNMLKNRGCEVILSANPAALKLLETADPERYYLKGVGFQDIEMGLKNRLEVDAIVGFAHNDAAVNYIISYKSVYDAKTYAIVFGREVKKEYIEDLEEEGITTYSARAFHNPIPIVAKLKEMLREMIFK